MLYQVMLAVRQKINCWTEAIGEGVELSEQPDSQEVGSTAATATTAEAISQGWRLRRVKGWGAAAWSNPTHGKPDRQRLHPLTSALALSAHEMLPKHILPRGTTMTS